MTRRDAGMNPKREAQAFRIWQLLHSSEDGMSVTELSRRLDIHKDTVLHIVRERGWRVRNGRADGLRALHRANAEPQELVFE